MDKTIFYFTYQLTNSGQNCYKYMDAIHCNYINKIEIDSTKNKEITIHFDNIDEFKFLTTNIETGTGFTATRIYLLVQKVNENEELVSNNWLKFNVTDQIKDHDLNNPISAIELTSSFFKISISEYNTAIEKGLATSYDLTYLNYPLEINQNSLSFGDEEYFIGNITTDIEATIHAMNISLPTTGFNCSSNKTWKGTNNILISEVGIYDINKRLVGIGKLNSPIKLPSTNVIVFGLDF